MANPVMFLFCFKLISICTQTSTPSPPPTPVSQDFSNNTSPSHHAPRFGTIIPNRIFVGGIDFKVNFVSFFTFIGPPGFVFCDLTLPFCCCCMLLEHKKGVFFLCVDQWERPETLLLPAWSSEGGEDSDWPCWGVKRVSSVKLEMFCPTDWMTLAMMFIK